LFVGNEIFHVGVRVQVDGDGTHVEIFLRLGVLESKSKAPITPAIS